MHSFICYKIDDEIACKVSNEKLTEIGLMYGDILAYHETFKESENNNTPTYEQRAAKLKSRLKRGHIIRMRSNKKPIKVQETIKVVFGITCLENKAYVAKKNKSFSEDCERNATYHDLHDICRTHFDVLETISTYFGFYSGKKLGQFTNLAELSYTRKNSRKKSLHIYLYYPKKYGHLEFKKLLKYSRKSHTSHSQELNQSNVELDNSGYENSVNLELPDVQWLDNEQAQVNTKLFCSL